MENEKNEKGYQITEKGQQVYQPDQRKDDQTNRQGADKKKNNNDQQDSPTKRFSDAKTDENKPLKNTEQVSRFIDEGNPNTQPVVPTKENNDQTQSTGVDQTSSKYPVFSSRPDRDDKPVLSGEKEGSLFPEEDKNAVQNIEKGINEETQVKPIGVDNGLAQEIKEDIQTDTSLADVKDAIYVIVENGVATLTGKVALEEQKITAGNKAIAYLGSDKVNNCINVFDKEGR